MAKYPYQVRVNEEKTVPDEENPILDSKGAKVPGTKTIMVWRTAGKQESLNEARKVAEGHGYNRAKEDVRIERVNGRLIENAGKLEA